LKNNSKMDTSVPHRPIRAAIVGTGYIAEFHARAIQAVGSAELVAVCDTNLGSARSFASAWNVPAAYDSFETMLAQRQIDCVHILVPPDLHFQLTKTSLEAGVHVFLEKPMCLTIAQADEMLELASNNQLYLGVNHNMMFFSSYQRLREVVHSGVLGAIDNIGINYFSELGQIRNGPFETWLLRAPGNVVLETGPHLFSILVDLVGPPGKISVQADRDVTIPGGAQVFRRWRVDVTSGRVAAQVHMNFGPGFNERIITVHGLAGTATADLNANTCLVDTRTLLDVDLDRYSRSKLLATQLRSQAGHTLRRYVLSKLKLRRGGNPYQLSFLDSVASFYTTLRERGTLDRRIDGAFGRDVISYCTKAIEAAGIPAAQKYVERHRAPSMIKPSVLVLGGAGFIGRELIRQLVASGRGVRALVRGSAAMLEEYSEQIEIVRGDLRLEADLKAAMNGIEYVHHLAVGQSKSWDNFRANEIDSARLVGEVCLSMGIKRLIYTGTIDSYYAGAKAGTITEQTPLDPNITRRNYYARAKAAAENCLLELYRTRRLPVIIFRPGIVIGRGGNPFHWGVGRFTDFNCEVWGEGDNPLPFVLATDVAAALIRGLEVPDIEGQSFNIVDRPLLTANDYLAELQQRSNVKLTILHRPIWQFYLADGVKWLVKVAVGHPDRKRIPSYSDWESRTQKAFYDSAAARGQLGCELQSNRDRMTEEGIGGSLEEWLRATR
jgi:predicted dehydrogenase/nucleoside-diphosphate-sugar epimerase